MANFDALIKKSLAIVNDGYQQALADVKVVVEKLSNAIRQNAGEHFALEVSEVKSDVKGVTFRIFLDTDVNDLQADIVTIVHIRILSKGYPILHGSFNKTQNVFVSMDGNELEDMAAVEQFFADLLADPESSLIQALGFAMRKKTY